MNGIIRERLIRLSEVMLCLLAIDSSSLTASSGGKKFNWNAVFNVALRFLVAGL